MRNMISLHNNKFKRIVKERWFAAYDSIHASISPDGKAKITGGPIWCKTVVLILTLSCQVLPTHSSFIAWVIQQITIFLVPSIVPSLNPSSISFNT